MKKGRSSHAAGSSSATLKPTQWPSDLQYMSNQCYHCSVPKDILHYLYPSRANATPATLGKPPVTIRGIVEESHPAKGQRGLFANKKIPPHTHIIDYVGEVHCDDRPDSDYDLSLYHSPEGFDVGVDASRAGNEARFINDYRGIRQRPNALFEERRTSRGEMCMSVWSGNEAIKKGEEILVSYGKGFWKARAPTSVQSHADTGISERDPRAPAGYYAG